MSEVVVTSENFEEEVLKSDIPVLVDFWAAWCGPCKMLAPVIAEIAEEMEGKVKVCKLNIDDEDELSEKYGVMSIPTVVLFKDGEEAKRSVGFVPKKNLMELLQ